MVVALVALFVALTGSAAAVTVSYALNSDKVDGKHAVGAGATLNKAAGKLVATKGTAPNKGKIPAKFIAKVNDADKLDGIDSTGFYGAGSKVADSNLLDGIDSTGFYGAGSKVADSNLLDGIDSTAFMRSTLDMNVASDFDNFAGDQSFGSVDCDAGMKVVGGGVFSSSPDTSVSVNSSWPLSSTSWGAYVNNPSAFDETFEVYVICAPASVVTFAPGAVRTK
jgi:hypothetical protein